MPHKFVKRAALALCLLVSIPTLHGAAASAPPPIVITLAMSHSAYAVLDEVNGKVTVAWPNGTRIVSAAIDITQRPQDFGSIFSSTASGPSDSTGQFNFSFAHDGSDYGSSLPGHHDLIIIVSANGITTRQVFGYDVSLFRV